MVAENIRPKLNYTTFFVVLSSIGVIVFFGIFGAAWMSAADQLKRGFNTVPVKAPTHLPDNVTEATDRTPSSTSQEITSATSTQISFTNSGVKDHGPTFNTTSTKNLEVITAENSEATTVEKSEVTKFENTEATTVSIFESIDGPVRKAPEESSQGIFPTEISCSLEKLTAEKGEIKPPYENKDTCQQWLVEYEEGYSVDITVDRLELDGDTSDYVLISPDENTTGDPDNPVLSWTLTGKKNYKIPYKGTAYILFVTHKSNETEGPDKNKKGFRIIYSRSGELATIPPTSTTGPIPDPIDEESIYISLEFSRSVSLVQIRGQIAVQANEFCGKNNITLNAAATYENVILTDSQPCLTTWPNSGRCWTYKMTIPVDTKNTSYELTKENLQKMWDEWDGEELIELGVKKTSGPNYKKNVIIWFLLCIVFIILFSVFLLFLWQWQLRNSIKPQENKERESQSIEVPPFFEYMDSRYDDPEYLPYADSMYDMGTETSTDDRFSYGALPPYTKRPSNVSTFQFGRPSNAGIDNNAFIEDDEEEYEIMNRASITKEVKKVDNEKEYKLSEQKEVNY